MAKKKREIIRFQDEFKNVTFLYKNVYDPMEDLYEQYLVDIGTEEAAKEIAAAYTTKSVPSLNFIEWGIHNGVFSIIPDEMIEEVKDI